MTMTSLSPSATPGGRRYDLRGRELRRYRCFPSSTDHPRLCISSSSRSMIHSTPTTSMSRPIWSQNRRSFDRCSRVILPTYRTSSEGFGVGLPSRSTFFGLAMTGESTAMMRLSLAGVKRVWQLENHHGFSTGHNHQCHLTIGTMRTKRCAGCRQNFKDPHAEGQCSRCKRCLNCCGRESVAKSCAAKYAALNPGQRHRSDRAFERWQNNPNVLGHNRRIV